MVRPQSSASQSRSIYLAAIAISLLVVAIYAGTLSVPLLFDDGPSILENPSIHQLWPPWRALSPPHGRGLTVEGRPILNYSLALNYAISGSQHWSYHLLNIAIHLGAALTLLGILRRTLDRLGNREAPPNPVIRSDRFSGGATWVAFSIALLWAVHPLQTESVTYVIQRAESLMGLFYLLTLYCFIRATEACILELRAPHTGRRLRFVWFSLSIGACLLGMASKEITYSAPLIVLLYDRAFVAGSLRAAWQQRRGYYFALACTWLLLGALLLGTGNRGGTAGFGIGVTPWVYAQAEFQAVAHYLWLCFWPNPLIFDYGVHWPHGAGEVVPYALIVGLLFAATVYCLVKRPAIGLLGAWFFSILAPTSSFLPGNRQTLAEHRMYLPLAAVLTLVIIAAHHGWRGIRQASWQRAGAVAALVGCVSICCALTIRRNRDYRSEIILYRDTVAKRPENAFAHYNLAHVLDETGSPEAAIPEYREAIRLDPQRAAAYNNLGKTLADLGRWPEAVAQYQAALSLGPGYARAHYNLGEAWLQLGKKEAAREQFGAAVRLNPADVEARDNLGGILLELHRLPEAIEQFEAVLRINPGLVQTHYMLGNALLLQGRAAEAIPHYEEALRLRPDMDDAKQNLELARRRSASR